MQLHWRISSAGVAGDPDKLVYVSDGGNREVSALFNTSRFLYRWRLRRVLRRLRAEWVRTYISGLTLSDPYECVR